MCLQVGCFGAADTRPSDVGQMPALLWLASPVGRRVRPGTANMSTRRRTCRTS